MAASIPMLACLATLLISAALSGAVVTLTPNADTGLRDAAPDSNSGIASDYIVGRLGVGEVHRALLRFDLSLLPTNAIIQQVQLGLADVSRQGAQAPAIFGLHRVLRPWAEGTNFGFGIASGEVSWRSARHGLEAWEEGGASGASDSRPEPSAVTGSGGSALDFTSTPGLVADVQQWLVNPGSNHGWLLYNDAESTPRSARRLASREHSSSPPRLIVHYVLPVKSTLESAALLANGSVRLTGAGTPGTTLNVEYSPDLKQWERVGDATADSTGRVVFTHDVAAGNTQDWRFYRLAE